MANVGERAQVLLMAALGMAILFVTLALILNTSIYTENLATRGSDVAGGGDVARFVDASRDGISGAVTYANYHNHTSDGNEHGPLHQNLSASVSGWHNATARQFALRGQSVSATFVGTENGTRIEQESDQNFTDDDGNVTWTVAEGVNGTRAFRIHVSRNDSIFKFGQAGAFNVTADNGSTTWTMNVTDTDSGVQVSVENGNGGQFNCTVAPPPLWIDVTGGTVAGDDCRGLAFAEDVGPPYNLTYNNGDNIDGNYTMVVTNTSIAENQRPHLHDEGEGEPFAAPAVYATNVSLTYHSPRLYYNGTIRVAPGEHGG